MIPKVGSNVYVQSYKHDGSLHRTWDQGFVLDSNDDHYVIVTNKTWVVEADGKRWYTKEPAVCYFPTTRWFNVIAMIRKDGIYYYCNLASPSLYDGEAIKYIDYDLDYKIYSDNLIITLDQDEYALHSKQMHYPKEIDTILKEEMARIVQDVKNNIVPFNKDYVEKHFEEYLKLLSYDKM